MSFSERGRRAALARLQVTDWTEYARPAFESPNHPGNIERWLKAARDANPFLNEEQAGRLAEMMRREHFAEMGRRSGDARRARRASALCPASAARAAAPRGPASLIPTACASSPSGSQTRRSPDMT